MPFITEEIWQRLPVDHGEKSIMSAPYPVAGEHEENEESVREIALLQSLVYAIRNIRGEMNVPPELRVKVLVRDLDGRIGGIVDSKETTIKFLAHLEHIECGDLSKPPGSASAVGEGFEVYLPLEGVIDIDLEKQRLAREMEKIDAEINKSRTKLQNEQFTRKAPPQVVEKEKTRLASFESSRERVKNLLLSISG